MLTKSKNLVLLQDREGHRRTWSYSRIQDIEEPVLLQDGEGHKEPVLHQGIEGYVDPVEEPVLFSVTWDSITISNIYITIMIYKQWNKIFCSQLQIDLICYI